MTTTGAILALDLAHRVRPVALGSPKADRLLVSVPEARRMDSFHVVQESGEVSSAGAGFAPLLRLLPGGWPLAELVERVPAGAEVAYRLVADNRTPLGRLIPGPMKARADWLIARRA